MHRLLVTRSLGRRLVPTNTISSSCSQQQLQGIRKRVFSQTVTREGNVVVVSENSSLMYRMGSFMTGAGLFLLGGGAVVDSLTPYVVDEINRMASLAALEGRSLPLSSVLDMLRNKKGPGETNVNASNVARPDVQHQLDAIFEPRRRPALYVVYGEEGTGKTSQLQSKAAQVGSGVAVVECGHKTEDCLAESIADSLHMWAFNGVSLLGAVKVKLLGTVQGTVRTKLQQVLQDVDRATSDYATKHNKSTVLIFDHVDELSPSAFTTLQKDMLQKARDKTVVPVICCSKPETLKAAQDLANAAGVPSQVILVDDLDQQQALHYLHNIRGLDQATSSALYHIFGGRVGHLQDAATAITLGAAPAQVVSNAMEDCKWSFKRAFPPTDYTQKELKKVMKKLLSSGPRGLSIRTFLSVLPKDVTPKEVKRLLNEDFLSLDHKAARVNFSSPLARAYAQETYAPPPKPGTSTGSAIRNFIVVTAPLMTAAVLITAQRKP